MGSLKSQKTNYYQEYGDFLPVLEHLLEDVKKMCGFISKADHIRDLNTLEKRVKAEGIGFVAEVLPRLASGLLEFLEAGTVSYPGFSLEKGKYPRFLKGYFKVATNVVGTTQHVNAVKAIYVFANAFKKLRMPLNVEDDAKLYSSLVKTDRSLPRLKDITKDDNLRQVLGLACHYARQFIDKLDINGPDFLPRPGPGATNTPCEKNMRYQPHVFYTQHEQGGLHYFDWFFMNSHDPFMRAEVFGKRYYASECTPTARFKTVPKTYVKGRGICIEENESQWLQQGIAAGLKKAISRDPVLSYCLPLDDQQVNAYLAHISSLDRNSATIDMSEASNRVVHWLPLVLFGTNDAFASALWHAATRWVDPPDDLFKMGHSGIRLNMFAPMGSGLCFPIMSLVHYYLIKAIIKRYHDCECNDIFVFGDDIVIPSAYYDCVTAILPCFGMKLNLSKSFHRSFFRESCGVHAYMGMDITPVYFKHTPSCQRMDAFLSCVAVESQLSSKGYDSCASYVRTAVSRYWHHPMPYVDEETSLVGWRRPTMQRDVQLLPYPRCWNADYQCWTYRLPIIVQLTESLRLPAYDSYLRWHVHARENANRVDTIAEDSLRVTFRWVPECHLNAYKWASLPNVLKDSVR